VIGLLFPLVFSVFAVVTKAKDAGGFLVAIMAFGAGVVGVWFFLAVGSDGSLTELSNGVSNVIASAATSTVWSFLTLMPLLLSLMAFFAGMYRGYEAFA
jgi:hypothetical protein